MLRNVVRALSGFRFSIYTILFSSSTSSFHFFSLLCSWQCYSVNSLFFSIFACSFTHSAQISKCSLIRSLVRSFVRVNRAFSWCAFIILSAHNEWKWNYCISCRMSAFTLFTLTMSIRHTNVTNCILYAISVSYIHHHLSTCSSIVQHSLLDVMSICARCYTSYTTQTLALLLLFALLHLNCSYLHLKNFAYVNTNGMVCVFSFFFPWNFSKRKYINIKFKWILSLLLEKKRKLVLNREHKDRRNLKHFSGFYFSILFLSSIWAQMKTKKEKKP